MPVQVQASTGACTGAGNADAVDPFQKLVIEKLTSLENLPTQLTEIQAVEQIKQENSDLKKSLERSTQLFASLNEIAKNQAKEINNFKVQLGIERQRRESLASRLSDQVKRNLQNEVYSRKPNLILEGLEETENENLELKYIKCLNEKFNINGNPSDI